MTESSHILVKVKLYIEKWLDAWCFFCLTAILFIVLYQVSSRYFAHLPLLWAQGACQLLLMHMVFLGAVTGLIRGSHIKIDLFTMRIPEAKQEIVKVLLGAFLIILLGFYVFSIYELLAHTHGIYSNPAIPMKVFYLPVFLGSILALVVVIIDFVLLVSHLESRHKCAKDQEDPSC